MKPIFLQTSLALVLLAAVPARADQVIPDDLIVQGSTCVGIDCDNNESFGFDTVRLKANDTRIKFEDTSASAGFPSNDWQLTANDTDSGGGGGNYFAIDDVTGAKTPLKIMAGAPSSSLHIDASGLVGLGTATPVLNLHIKTGTSPAIRLEQDANGGWGPYTWDLGGNDAGFFIRDLTGGSNLPLRIRPGAPTSSIDIAADGKVGIGNSSPAASLHISGNQGSSRLRVEDANATTAARTLLALVNNGGVTASYSVGSGVTWETRADAGSWTIAQAGAPGSGQFRLDDSGNLAISGTLSQGSSRTLKTDIRSVDRNALLDKVLALPLYAWRYKSAPVHERHLGPMAEDFHELFGTGSDPRRLAPSDVAGVALGALQALAGKVAEKDTQIDAIKRRIEALEARLANAR
jgi:hypothetical protein